MNEICNLKPFLVEITNFIIRYKKAFKRIKSLIEEKLTFQI